MGDSVSQRDGISQATSQTGRYLWIALPLITGAVLAQALPAYGIPVLYPFIQSEFGLSYAQVGLITSSLAIGITAAVVLAGWLTDSLGVKRMIVISLLSIAAFTLAFPLAYFFPVILALVACIGIVSSPVYPATTQAIMDWFPGRIRALAMSLKQTGFPIAGAIMAAVLSALTGVVGWRNAAAVTGLLILVIAIAFMLWYRDIPRGREVVRGSNFDTLQTILRNRSLVTTIIWGATFVGLQYIVLTYFMLFVIEELALSPIVAGGLLAIAQVSSSVSRVLWGAASDFVFHGRRIAALSIIGFLTVIWLLVTSLMTAGVPMTVVLLIAIVIGISTISFHGVFTTLIGELAKAGHVGVTVGVTSMMMHISQVVMPPLFGHLVDMSGSYNLGWRVAAAVALVCTLALLLFGREPQRH